MQIASLSVPTGVEVSGGALSRTGAVVFWSRESKTVMASNGASFRALCRGEALDPLSAAFSESSRHIEIVDGRSGRIFQATVNGMCRVGPQLGRAGTILAASYSRSTKEWIVLSHRNGRSVLVTREAGRPKYLPIPFVPIADLKMTHMTVSPTGVVLSSLKAPFNWTLVSLAGRMLVWGRPFASDTIVAHGSDSAPSSQLLGMATHSVGDGFVQLLADPRTDLRVFVFYGLDGRASRRTTIGVSLGFLDYEPAATRFLAFRRTDSSELVTYLLARFSR